MRHFLIFLLFPFLLISEQAAYQNVNLNSGHLNLLKEDFILQAPTPIKLMRRWDGLKRCWQFLPEKNLIVSNTQVQVNHPSGNTLIFAKNGSEFILNTSSIVGQTNTSLNKVGKQADLSFSRLIYQSGKCICSRGQLKFRL